MCHPDNNPFPMVLTPDMAPINIMMEAVKSPANGYPNINHVWFEQMEIDDVARTIKFHMGS